MSRVGLILGGGGVTGASYHLATLLAIQMATGWDPATADVIVGTSAGAFAAAVVRGGALGLDSIVHPGEDRAAVARRIGERVYRKSSFGGVGRWIRRGVVPSIRHPGVTVLLGAPGRFDASGIGDWVREQVPHIADSWPDRPTVVVAYDIDARRRVPFGTESAPDVTLADAVAASSAVPVVFSPYVIKGTSYVDGGVVSGTNADLVLGDRAPLDLLLAIAPMAAEEERRNARFPESLFDRVGRSQLQDELAQVAEVWPDTATLVIRPSPQVLEAMRPNPMSADRAVPTFIRALASMRAKLAKPQVWKVLEEYLT